tara:strand:+ start:1894 stop:2694 length:801 start_codon:yes stop_codon:yes gene_type:complete
MGGASSEANTQPAAPVVASYQPKQGLTTQQRLRQSLYLLEEGDAAAARMELMLYLDAQPDSRAGRDLLQQIDLSAWDYFPEDYREIELASGQSLSNISKAYLGSLYKFHALAKYNGIAKPRKLGAGQKIRIPLTPQAQAVFDALDNPESSEQLVSEVEDALEADPDLDVEAQLEADEVTGDLLIVEQPLTESEKVVEVLEVESAPALPAPDVEAMHREALNAYRAQDLTRAIELWDQVLAIDPGYENASLYRSQALELQKKLRSLM